MASNYSFIGAFYVMMKFGGQVKGKGKNESERDPEHPSSEVQAKMPQ